MTDWIGQPPVANARPPAPDPRPPTPDPWVMTLRSVVLLAEESDIQELEIQSPGLRIALRRVPLGESADAALSPRVSSGAGGGADSPFHAVRCPLTGIWYDAPAPGAPPLVRVGDFIGVGAVVGLLETMKVFNEVHSDAAGIVRQVLVRRGDLVLAHSPVITMELTGVSAPVAFGGLA